MTKTLILLENVFFNGYLTSRRSSKRQSGEPALFAYDILTGNLIFIKEFPRDNENQVLQLKILKNYTDITNNKAFTLIQFRKDERKGKNIKGLVLINNSNGLKTKLIITKFNLIK